ncbi:MAG: hypothetical protein WEB00_06060 [Dehalococcoidia bacterium]
MSWKAPQLPAAVVAALGALTLSFVPISAPVALADINGPCSASIDNESVGGRGTGPTDDPIEVDNDQPVEVAMAADREVERLVIDIEFWGVRFNVAAENDVNGAEWAETIDVNDYATYGAGLYKVIGESYDSNGNLICSGEALVNVSGNPIFTLIGGISATLAVMGLLGMLNILRDFFRAASIMALILLSLGMVSPAGGYPTGAVAGSAPRDPGPKVSFKSITSGLFLGLGSLGLLQQFGIFYPTLVIAIAFIVGGIVLGVVLSLLSSASYAGRVSRARATQERRAFQESGAAGGPVAEPPPPTETSDEGRP